MNSLYSIKRSKKARRGRITVMYTGEVIITVPYNAPLFKIEKFFTLKYPWIKKTQDKLKKKFEGKAILQQSQTEYNELKQKALILVQERLKYFNTSFYRFKFNSVRIKNHSSRWGSCSSRGNLNFNYKIIHLPHEVADYIIVHELCHLKEFNHSKAFWDLVAVTIPDWKVIRKKLKNDYIAIQ